MKKILTLFALLAVFVASATQINFGSYNIRVLVADDLGVHHWDNRKDYVARTVVDNKMEICGFNEVKCQRQLPELQELLPDYTFYCWDGHEGYDTGNDTPVNCIAWLTDKFEKVDGNWFFLNRNPEGKIWNEIPWDNSSIYNVRNTAWVRLRAKATGEEFYVFCTHLDHQGNVARMLQAFINVDMTWKIAGNMPVVMLGDQNSTSTRINFLNVSKANFFDAFAEAGAAAVYGDDPATAGQWKDDPSDGRRIDYIFYRGFDVKDYKHCTENYDLGGRPSDHIAICATLELRDPAADRFELYVKAGADGDGSKENPFGSLASAISAAPRFGATIYVAEGDYPLAKSVGVAKSVKILGGYNDDFTEVTGLSRFDGQKTVRVFDLKELTQVEMHNIGIYNGVTGDNGDGAGIRAHGSRVILRNCEFADNAALRDGGAIDVNNQAYIYNCRFLRNSAVRNGGAICTDNPNKRYYFNQEVEGCTFIANAAASGAALQLPRFIYGRVIGNTASENVSTDGPTFFIQAQGSDNNLGSNLSFYNNTIVNNTAEGETGAGAAYIAIEPQGKVGIAYNTIFGNTSNPAVGAVYVKEGDPYINSNIIASNIGGDIFVNKEEISAANNVVTCTESNDLAITDEDPVSADMESSNAVLARVLDAKIVDGKLIANLTLPEEGAPAEGMTDFRAPGVRILDPAYSEVATLNTLSSTRLRESILRVDANNDCTYERPVLLEVDQLGLPRPTDGSATIGAREYVAGQGGLENIAADRFDADSSLAPVEYFDLQGRRVAVPAKGIYIRRQGTEVSKIALR